ncbi:MAG: polyprenyl synthetase family protein, partial [Bdellovibrionota bacterium]
RKKTDITFSALERVSSLKTGSLMSWCCTVGARLVNRSDELTHAAQLFGESLGIAFQMIDDILDFEVTSEKPFAQDLREGLVNFVVAELIHGDSTLASPVSKILGSPQPGVWPWTDEQLAIAKAEVRTKASERLADARKNLDTIRTLSGATGPSSDHALQSLEAVLSFLSLRIV